MKKTFSIFLLIFTISFHGQENIEVISSGTSGDAILKIEADTDNNNEGDNPRIELRQDGGLHGAYIGFSSDWGGSYQPDNLFRIGTRSGGIDDFSRFVINPNNGYTGIGTNNPISLLHITSLTSGDAVLTIEADTDNNNESDNVEIKFIQDGGLVNGFIGFEGNANVRSPGTLANAFMLGSEDTEIARPVQVVVSDQVQMTVHSNGVGIGTTTPDEKLSVNGNIHTKEVRVDLTGWSDFVFEENYELPTLQEVEKHIKEKGHLQDIPSAKEVEEKGILLGDMNAKLLQKIEELTLYTIEQQKQINLLLNKIDELETK